MQERIVLIRLSLLLCLIAGVPNLRAILIGQADFATFMFLLLDICFIYAFTNITGMTNS